MKKLLLITLITFALSLPLFSKQSTPQFVVIKIQRLAGGTVTTVLDTSSGLCYALYKLRSITATSAAVAFFPGTVPCVK